jgi:hypothetical protein
LEYILSLQESPILQVADGDIVMYPYIGEEIDVFINTLTGALVVAFLNANGAGLIF